MESRPNCGPTVLSWSSSRSTGRLPARSTATRSSTSSWVKSPVILPLPAILSCMTGALLSTPSRTIASSHPRFLSVTEANFRLPFELKVNATAGLSYSSVATATSARYSPVISARSCSS